MVDAYSFNPGRLPSSEYNIQFHPKPQRLMEADIYIFIEGGHSVGDTVRVKINRPKMIEMDPSEFATQWHRDGKAIPWENDRTYVYREEDRGHYIGCWVTDSKRLESEPVCVR